MTKEELFAPIREKYNELKNAIEGTDIDKIRELTLEVMQWFIQQKFPEEQKRRLQIMFWITC